MKEKRRHLKFLLLALLVVSLSACIRSHDYDEIPHLEFRGFSKDIMKQGSNQQDSVIMTLFFTDGDGDFGSSVGSSESNIFLKDLRTNEIFREFKAPFVPEDGAKNGISGTISVKIYTTCCVYEPSTGIPPCERTNLVPENVLPLEVYIKDRSGNVSNIVRATDLILKCDY